MRALKRWVPPILWESGRWILERSRPHPKLHPGGHEGPFSSWADAVAVSDGWDAPVIVQKTFDASMQVKNGEAAFEQDTVLYPAVRYSPTILSFLLMAHARVRGAGGTLDIVDFGGSLGTNFVQNRKLLHRLCGTRVTWTVIERPALVELGTEYFANDQLRFVPSLEAAARLIDGPSAVLFSGSLQFVSDPFAVVREASETGARVLACDRLLVSPGDTHRIYVQHPDPEHYYPATYPTWCFGRDSFVESLDALGFDLVEHFTENPAAHFNLSGMLFVRR